MYDFYQVESVHVQWYPYKWELASSNTGVNRTFAKPTYSCIDPESTGPTLPGGLASYGNMKTTLPYH